MSDDAEPSRNISGGPQGGGTARIFESGTASTRAGEVVDRLGELYWQKTYGGRAAFACLVRTILSQNTSDAASQPAYDALVTQYADDRELLEALANAEQEVLASTISGAGLHNQKSARIISIARRIREEYDGADGFDTFVRNESAEVVRKTLLSMTGVGAKTADCVLLFAGGRDGVFPVDTHVHRIYRRLGIAPPDADHETVREILEQEVPPETCGFGHTASIQFGREYCSARDPACLDGPEACPLSDLCDRVGVDIERGAVRDPAETVGD